MSESKEEIAKERRIRWKTKALCAEYGDFVRKWIRAKRIPHGAIENLYGRHADRIELIFAYMRAGDSYNTVYKVRSTTAYDTKNWMKVPIRTSTCLGHVKAATVSLAHQVALGDLTADQRDEIRRRAGKIRTYARTLIKEISRYETVSTIPKQRSKPAQKRSRDRSFGKVKRDLKTAASKLEKNCRDIPLAENKLGEKPTGEVVAKTVAEAKEIMPRVSALLQVLDGNV